MAGVLTIGYGSTGPHVKPGMKITEAEAEALLSRDLDRFERAISEQVKVPLTGNQFSALVAWAFNVGTAATAGSTLIRNLNRGDYHGVPDQLARWNKAGGKVVKGLVNRRAAEAVLWRTSGASAEPPSAEPDLKPAETPKPSFWSRLLAALKGTK